MRRRDMIFGGLASIVVPIIGIPGVTPARAQSADEFKRRIAELQAQALAKFTFRRIETHGSKALATWEELKAAGDGVPVILGSGDDLANIYGVIELGRPTATLQAAAAIEHPKDLFAMRVAEDLSARQSLKRLLEERPEEAARFGITAEFVSEPMREPEVGPWPFAPTPSPGLTVAYDILSRRPLETVHLAIIPTKDWTEIPAYLNWGGWNQCPAPEYHVAAFRSWRDRYGAELVGLASDTMNLRVARRPESRDEALALAREQYAYCADIVDQGTGTLSELAATLMSDNWWFFWWD